MKKNLTVAFISALFLAFLIGCESSTPNSTFAESGSTTNTALSTAPSIPAANTAPITVISREEGSGTRGAFIELFGVEVKDASGAKVDQTIAAAEVTSSTAVMMTSITSDKNAIGYISLGSLNNTVKAAKIDGVEPTVANIKSGSYTISRPFVIVTPQSVNPVAQDFIDYILSSEGQSVVESKGYIRLDNTKAFSGSKPPGKIIVAGSSSVTPVMEALKEAYEKMNDDATIDIQTSDSTTGINATIDGICDIGMASREVKDSELEKGIKDTKIAVDGIVVIINKANTVESMTKDQVKGIYTGLMTKWSDVR